MPNWIDAAIDKLKSEQPPVTVQTTGRYEVCAFPDHRENDRRYGSLKEAVKMARQRQDKEFPIVVEIYDREENIRVQF